MYDKDIDYFITPQSFNFFERFDISKEFVALDPTLWSSNEDFLKGLRIVENLKVVNDTAERAVRLIEEYNNILTRNEDQKQFLLQVVTEFRKKIPDSKKETVIKGFTSKIQLLIIWKFLGINPAINLFSFTIIESIDVSFLCPCRLFPR